MKDKENELENTLICVLEALEAADWKGRRNGHDQQYSDLGDMADLFREAGITTITQLLNVINAAEDVTRAIKGQPYIPRMP